MASSIKARHNKYLVELSFAQHAPRVMMKEPQPKCASRTACAMVAIAHCDRLGNFAAEQTSGITTFAI